MAEIPQPTLDQKTLEHWWKLQEKLRKLKAEEAQLRRSIFGLAFPDPKEGTNNYELDDGYVLKGGHTITRTVDKASLDIHKEALKGAKIPVAKLVEMKPSLVKSEYNRLSDEQRKVFDECLTIKPGSPSLSIELPAKNANKAKKK